jgi:hypothetical protein
MTKQRTFWFLVVVGAALLGVHSARSQPASLKLFKTGDLLTADDLNANFAAVAAQAAGSVPYAWSAFAPAQDAGRLEGAGKDVGRVASFSFASPVAGSVLVSATYEVRVRNSFDAEATARQQCRIETLLNDAETGFVGCPAGEPCNLSGYAQNSINANLPTQEAGGTYLGASQAVSRVLPLAQGLNTYHLIGRTQCPAAIWGAISFTALTVQPGGTATTSIF